MNYTMLTAVLLGVICVFAEVEAHSYLTILLCQTNDTDPEDVTEVDEEELFYHDIRNKKTVMTIPSFFGEYSVNPGDTGRALADHTTCLFNLEKVERAEQSPPEEIDPPQITIYSRNEVSLGKSNILICLVNNFYPPTVKVKWTKNNVEVKEGVTVSRYYPNKDYTFHQFSTLSVTPEEGDIYSCKVEHKGLSQPETRIWEPDFQSMSNMGATAFCGIGLTLGLLGVGVGTFFLIKGNNCT